MNRIREEVEYCWLNRAIRFGINGLIPQYEGATGLGHFLQPQFSTPFL